MALAPAPEKPPRPRLTGPQKAAILFLCLDDKRGADLMQGLEDPQIRLITETITQLGVVSADAIEEVIAEFSVAVKNGGTVVGSLDRAEKLLRNFLPDEKVRSILAEISGPSREHDLWRRFSDMSENMIANYLKGEHDQTAAAILSNVKPDVAARVLPLLGEARMEAVLERMMRLETILPQTLQQIEQSLQIDILSAGGRSTSAHELESRMANLFNKLDHEVFDRISVTLEERMPERFMAIKKRMFTFEDMRQLDSQTIATIIRGIEGNTLPLALRSASKAVRNHFLDALPGRARDMMIEEMNNMGPVRARDSRQAQADIVDYARQLAEQEVIFLPSGDEEAEFV